MTQPPLVTMPTYTVETPCLVTVANTEPTRQPSQMSEPDGVKDTIPKEVLVGVANPPKPVDEMTAETILACRQKDKMKGKRRQYNDGNKARRQAYAKQYYHKNKNKIRERQKLCHRQKRNKLREIPRTRQSPHASNRMKPLLKLPFEHRGLRMVLESNNKSNEVDLAGVFLFPHLSKRGVGQSKLQKPNGKKSALFSQGRPNKCSRKRVLLKLRE